MENCQNLKISIHKEPEDKVHAIKKENTITYTHAVFTQTKKINNNKTHLLYLQRKVKL
jgi:hypothetical protein